MAKSFFTNIDINDNTVKGWKVVLKTTNYTATVNDYFIKADATTGNMTITLPVVSGNSGLLLNIKKIDNSVNTVTVDGNGSETIDEATTQVLSTQYDSVSIYCDGIEWWIY